MHLVLLSVFYSASTAGGRDVGLESGGGLRYVGPRIYSVSLGAKLEYLDAIVCSNAAFVTVK